MKIFAIDFLSDTLGGKNIKHYQPSQVSAFANFVAYIINRELDLNDHLSVYSVESMVKDGILGHGAGLGKGEHIMTINLQIGDF